MIHIARVFLLLLCCVASVCGQTGKAKPKRARPPKWTTFPADIFFKDAFREGLVGTRPDALGGKQTRSGDSNTGKQPDTEDAKASRDSWSEIVSASTLEDEVKSLQIQVQKTVTTPGRFSSGGFREVRRQFTELATLFAVIGNYDGQVRWKKDAPLARDLFARAAANAKVTSIQAFNEAKQRKLDISDLVGGSTLTAKRPAEKENDWESICDRGPLMQRIETGFESRLKVWTANEGAFGSSLEKIKREAEMMQVFAVVMTRDGMEDAGDEDYVGFCDQLKTGASAVLQSVRDKDSDSARKAVSDVGKACVACHDDYRG